MDLGYCHFNEGSENIFFQIDVFGVQFSLKQEPGSRVLGHGAVVWDSSVVFAKYMEHNPKLFVDVEGKKVLELGSGCGLAGLCYMIKGAQVTLTDLSKVTDTLTIPNAMSTFSRINSLGSSKFPRLFQPIVTPLDWTDREASLAIHSTIEGSVYFDVILLTDCVFNQSLTSDIIATLREHSNHRTEVYCCYEIRDEEINGDFLQQLGIYYQIKRIKTSSLHPNYSNELIQLIRAKLKRKGG